MNSDIDGNARSATDEAFLAPFSNPKVATTLALATLLLTAFFYLLPGIDIAVSNFFFVPETCPEGVTGKICGSFPAASDGTLNDIRDFFHHMPIVVAALSLIAAIAISISREAALQRLAQGIYVAVISFVVSSLFVVNMLLKANSGRPRPVQTDLFGGDLPFAPAGQFTDFCVGNCSFVSGESSAAFWMVGLSALFPARWRGTAMGVALVMATFAAGMRVAFGGHYFSDVVVAAVLSVAIFAIFATVARLAGIDKYMTALTAR